MAKNKITEKEILDALQGNNSKKLQQIITYIDDNTLVKYGDALCEALEKRFEQLDGSTQSQYFDIYELCMVLGYLKHQKSIPLLKTIALACSGIASLGAGCAYIRLASSDKTDFSKVFDFFEIHLENVKNEKWGCLAHQSALFAINFDRMVPNLDNQKKFMAYSWDFISNFELEKEGYNSRCVALIASCCAGFDKTLTESILQKIYEFGLANGHYAKMYAENAMKGRYSHYDPSA